MKAGRKGQDGIFLLIKMYIFDTDIIVDFLRNKENIKKLIYDIYTKKVCITFITASELYFGAYNSKFKDRHFWEIGFLDGLVDILYPDLNVCKLFGKVKKELKDAGKTIGDFDIMIAAIAIANDFTLITRNIKHFENIKGLKIMPL